MSFMQSHSFSRLFTVTILLLGIVFSGALWSTEIPATACKNLAATIDSQRTLALPQALKIAASQIETLNSPMELVKFASESLKLGLEPQTSLNLLMENPYVQLMDFPKAGLETALLELQRSRDFSVQNSQRIFTQEISAFRNGSKAMSSKRKYDLELRPLPIEDQCGLGSCWVYGAKTVIEYLVHYLKYNAHRDQRLSQFKEIPTNQVRKAIEHYYAQYIFNEVLLTIKNGKLKPNGELFEQGGFFTNFLAYAKEFGVGVPAEQWKPMKSYKRALYKDRFLTGLKNIALYYHEQIKEVRERELSYSERNKKIKELIAEASLRLETNIETYTDELDHNFTIGQKSHTAASFYNDVLLPAIGTVKVHRLSPYRQVLGRRNAVVDIIDKDLNESTAIAPTENYAFPKSDMEKLILSELAKGKAVYISTKIPTATYKDPATGELHKVINAENGLTTKFGFEDAVLKIRGGHALAVIGAELDSAGRIRTLLLQNSWSEKHGDLGRLHADVSFTWAYTTNIISIETIID